MAANVQTLTSSISRISLGSSGAVHTGLRQQLSCQPSAVVVQRGPVPRGLNIRCARVAGVEIPNAKRIETSLTYIHGIGNTTARQVLMDVGLDNKYTRELSEEELTRLRDEVAKYMTEGDLRRFNLMNIKRLKDIMCYRGRRHIAQLPCRGQGTKNNARTRRGKKQTVAGKKK